MSFFANSSGFGCGRSVEVRLFFVCSWQRVTHSHIFRVFWGAVAVFEWVVMYLYLLTENTLKTALNAFYGDCLFWGIEKPPTWGGFVFVY